jgi:Zn-dependent protease with chaperone function
MHWVLILAVIVATTLAEHAPQSPVDHPFARVLLTVAAMLIAPAMAMTLSSVVVRGIRDDQSNWAAWLARFSQSQQLHGLVWLALVTLISYVFAWPQLVRENWGLANWILVDDLLILAPIYVPLLLSWAAFYDVDRAVDELTAERAADVSPVGRWNYVLLHARHYLGLVMAPLLVVLGLFDLARYAAPDFLADPNCGWFLLPPLALLVVLLPVLLATMWKTERLADGMLRRRLEAVLAETNLHVREILVWQTNGRLLNAAVSGLWSRLRYVFVTDRLLEQLPPEQVIAVLRHEAGHVVRRHLLLRMLLLGLPAALWYGLAQAAPGVSHQIGDWLAIIGLSATAQQNFLFPAAMAAYGLIVLGWYSRQLEYEADLFACEAETADERRERTAAFVQALQTITVESGADPHRTGWLHPSMASRLEFVRAAAETPRLADRFRRRLRCYAWWIASLYVMSFALVVLSSV